MMEGMFAVMQRINEIRQRFHPARENRQAPEPRADFGAELSRRIDDAPAPGNGNAMRYPAADALDSMSAAAFRDLARDYAARNRLSPSLVNAVIEAESSYNPRAVSPRGAMGLMQLMPEVAQSLGVENPFEPEENIRGGVTHLRRLMDKYRGDYRLALAAYNAGEGAVDRAGGVPDYPETREYVNRVIQSYLRNRE
ncbi:MAG TPA: lytic transglycosylase domain-containing protein [Spirochaetota bacterium]|nr:lytic transglycosylase domain-containing protein [Spirochaetota bacterium]